MAEPDSLLPALIQEELARLVDSDALRRAPSHARLLRYLVESRIAGDDTALRETSIALEVFRRDPATYDPRTDPIVRVTTGRLRDRLEAHYSRFDAPPKLRIVLPKGRYAPEFVAQEGAAGWPIGLGVLRTRNHTGDGALDGVCDAFADQLADRLARLGLPRVMARGSVDSAEAVSRDVSAVGAQLHVPWLLDSTLSREQKQELRLSVRLVHAADAGVRWVETGVGDDDDVYRLLDRMLDVVSLRTVETLPAGSAPRTDAGTPPGLPASQRAALDHARLMLIQRTVPGTDQAITLAEAVARAHPDAPDAWAMVAAANYSRLSFQDRDPAPIVAQLRATAERALALDRDQPTALRTLAILLGKHDYDAGAAESLFERALRTLPHYTSARLNYAEILTLQGKFVDALAQLNLARLHDPLSATVHLARGICLGYQRQYDGARDALSLCRAAGETSIWLLTSAGMNELAAGKLDTATTLLGEAATRFPDMPAALAGLACLHAARGDAERARALDNDCALRFPHFAAANRAVVAAMLRDKATTLQYLDLALVARDMTLLAATMLPAFDWLADDADFRRLRSRCAIWARRAEPAAG
ncbi:MAG: tetratricopeptide repeat protein [Betaproteobacteria bacterium]